MTSYRKINRNPSKKDLVLLCVVFVLGFGVLGLHQHFVKHRELASEVIWALGATLAVTALIPGIGRRLYVAWMALGVTIGMFTQPVFLFVVFTLVFVPISLIFRITGRNAMKQKRAPGNKSYWEPYEESDDKGSYFKQY